LIKTVAGFADNIVSAHITVTTGDFKTLNAEKANIQELCVGSTCITETQLQNILNQAEQQPVSSPQPAAIDTTSSTATNTAFSDGAASATPPTPPPDTSVASSTEASSTTQ
jgi:hypothetical protein